MSAAAHSSRTACMSIDAVVHAAARDGSVELDLTNSSKCDGCAGICMWRQPLAVNRARFRCALALHAGDAVTVSVPAAYVLLGSCLLHGLPLASLLLGALLGALATQTDAGCFAGAVAGLAIMLLATPRLRRRVEQLTLDHVVLEPVP